MTTISGISNTQLSSIFQLSQTRSAQQAGGQSGSDAVHGDRPPGPPPGGGMVDAIMQALSDIGATGQESGSTSSSSTSATPSDSSATSTDTQALGQAFGAFMHNLFDALRSQNGSGATADGNNGSNDVAQAQGAHRHHGGSGNIQSDLQSLIQKLSSSDSSSDSDSPPSSLQQSFSNLMSALGAGNSNASVNTFLQALQNNLAGVSASGNIVNTTA